jgi:hypothetical protein
MTSPTLSPPRRPAGRVPPQPEVRRAAARWERPRHHEQSRKVWGWVIGASVLVHLLVLFLSPIFLRVGLPPGETGSAPETVASRGLQMVDLEPRPETAPLPEAVFDASPADPSPVDRLPPRADRPEPRDAPAAAMPTRPGDAPRTGAPQPGPRDNPLQPGLRDSRLWITPREVPRPEPTQEELHAQYMSRLEARIRAINDSIAGEADRARRATDWTVRDGSGGRWGVSPEGIHLGGVTIPSEGFTPGGGDPDKRARAEEQNRTRSEIDRQEAEAERRRVREERIRATRERNDRERNAPP